jgi:hypothetical protein
VIHHPAGGVPGHGQISGFDVNIDGRTAPNSLTFAVAAVTDAIGMASPATRVAGSDWDASAS